MPLKKYKIALMDDYQNVALKSADWSVLRDQADITVFQDHLADPDAVIERLLPFDVVCVVRERTPLPRKVIERSPNLKLIASTGLRKRVDRCRRRGVANEFSHSQMNGDSNEIEAPPCRRVESRRLNDEFGGRHRFSQSPTRRAFAIL
jgi:hypothetical protein